MESDGPSQDWISIIAERKIQEAIDDGLFNNLAGAGKPIDLSKRSDIFSTILQRSGVLPGWAQIEQAVRTERADADAMLARWERSAFRPMPALEWVRRRNQARSEYERHLRAANDLVLQYNLTSGFVHRSLMTLPVQDLLRAFDDAFPLPAAGVQYGPGAVESMP